MQLFQNITPKDFIRNGINIVFYIGILVLFFMLFRVLYIYYFSEVTIIQMEAITPLHVINEIHAEEFEDIYSDYSEKLNYSLEYTEVFNDPF